ncbi:hypothetical protein V6N13_091057 [Hibiscus sabdariffa]
MWVKEEINGRVMYEFDRVFDYTIALRQVDPNCNVDLMVLRPSPNHPKIFRRIYIYFGQQKRDSEIIAAVGRDANDQIYPIAWAVVEVETKETWRWFLKNLKTNIHLGGVAGFIIMSDIQKGLIEEISLTLPAVEHHFCAGHFYSNWKKMHKVIELQKLFWSCCKCTNEADFYQHASRLGELQGKVTSNRKLSSYCHVNWNGAEGYKVTRRKSYRITNLSPESKGKAPVACSIREVTDVKGKGKAKEQPRTQPIRPKRKLQFPDTKNRLQKRKEPWK